MGLFNYKWIYVMWNKSPSSHCELFTCNINLRLIETPSKMHEVTETCAVSDSQLWSPNMINLKYIYSEDIYDKMYLKMLKSLHWKLLLPTYLDCRAKRQLKTILKVHTTTTDPAPGPLCSVICLITVPWSGTHTYPRSFQSLF